MEICKKEEQSEKMDIHINVCMRRTKIRQKGDEVNGISSDRL